MTIPSQHYAFLANDSYEDRRIGVRSEPYTELVTIDDVDYRVLEHVNNPRNGYQGTIYQRAHTHEIVVAHRGTEMKLTDVLADSAMVTSRANPPSTPMAQLA